MDKMKVIAGMLIMIALVGLGLPCWVCRQREMMGGLRYIYGGK